MAGLPKHESAVASLESGDPSLEKPTAVPIEDNEDIQALAARGHFATDQYVSSHLFRMFLSPLCVHRFTERDTCTRRSCAFITFMLTATPTLNA